MSKVMSGYKCWHCQENSVIWDADFNFEDFCMEGEGIVSCLHCTNCNAQIKYEIYQGEVREQELTKEFDLEEEMEL